METRLHDIGENALLKTLLPGLPSNSGLRVGPGDDCAVVSRDEDWDTLLKTDAVVEGVHFLPSTDPFLTGRKAMARALSDVAAMGGIPEHALVTLLIHPSRTLSGLVRLYDGMAAIAGAYGVSIAGGETTSLPFDGMAVSIALTGRVERGQAFLRSTGRPGDLVCVTGKLGGSFASGRHLGFTPRLDVARALLEEGRLPSAMMDLSDGLGTDLPRLADASGCSFSLEENSLPCHDGCTAAQALGDGEDYELLFTVPPGRLDRVYLAGRNRFPVTPVTVVGTLVPHTESPLPPPTGWQHFQG